MAGYVRRRALEPGDVGQWIFSCNTPYAKVLLEQLEDASGLRTHHPSFYDLFAPASLIEFIAAVA